jgi:2-keto-4-pentenoate hydratase/2-oxohepta-3-ene-1,7-dioic acid hydratase in catechol pathway
LVVGATEYGLVRQRGDSVESLESPFRDLGAALAAGVTTVDLGSYPVRDVLKRGEVRLRAPVACPRNLWAVGLAYRDHVAEAASEVSLEPDALPALFLKASSSVVGPEDPICLPHIAPSAVDYEGEVALVIGKTGQDISPDQAWSHVFGITAANDVSARDVQQGRFFGGLHDATKAKSFDTFTPLGPWVVTPDEFASPDDIALRTFVNGVMRQNARTSLLIHPVPAIVAAVSRFARLEPGDVILTGTPAGVGAATGEYLAPGDVVRVEVEHVGELVNPVVRSKAP